MKSVEGQLGIQNSCGWNLIEYNEGLCLKEARIKSGRMTVEEKTKYNR